MIRNFKTNSEYSIYTAGGLKSGDLYYVEESNSVHFKTNNITGSDHVFNLTDDGYISYGTSYITSNGNYDVSSYANAYVDVPVPEGYIVPAGNISLLSNGENIDVTSYATASVNVPIPEGYIVPTGSTTISQNGEDIDIAQYATVTVNVAGSSTPQYTELNLNTFTGQPGSNNKNYYYGITVSDYGKTLEVYNPNHLPVVIGQGQMTTNPNDGTQYGPIIAGNSVGSIGNDVDSYDEVIIENLYMSQGTDQFAACRKDFAIQYFNNAGTTLSGVIYYRVF